MSVMDWDGSMAGWCAEAGAEVSALGLSTPSVLPRTSVPAAAGVAEDPWFPEDSGSEDDDSSEDDENEYVAVHIDRSFEPPELQQQQHLVRELAVRGARTASPNIPATVRLQRRRAAGAPPAARRTARYPSYI